MVIKFLGNAFKFVKIIKIGETSNSLFNIVHLNDWRAHIHFHVLPSFSPILCILRRLIGSPLLHFLDHKYGGEKVTFY